LKVVGAGGAPVEAPDDAPAEELPARVEPLPREVAPDEDAPFVPVVPELECVALVATMLVDPLDPVLPPADAPVTPPDVLIVDAVAVALAAVDEDPEPLAPRVAAPEVPLPPTADVERLDDVPEVLREPEPFEVPEPFAPDVPMELPPPEEAEVVGEPAELPVVCAPVDASEAPVDAEEVMED